MNNIKLFGFYTFLEKLGIVRNCYMLKVVLTVLIASLLPLLITFIYMLLLGQSTLPLLFPLFISIASIGLHILLLYLLLKPVLFTAKQLDNYVSNEVTLHLPTEHKDDIGMMMSHVQYVTQKLEFLTRSQNQDSNLDPLTGVLNRQAGEERLRQDIARASRDGNKVLVALLDIDNFSQINERFGRHVGDVCLSHIAEVTMNNIRKGDWIARWGGDRFLMILWNFNNGEPEVVLERIKKQSVHTPMNKLLKLTISIGACDYQNEVDVDLLLGKLNECMYQAKQAGTDGIQICQKNK